MISTLALFVQMIDQSTTTHTVTLSVRNFTPTLLLEAERIHVSNLKCKASDVVHTGEGRIHGSLGYLTQPRLDAGVSRQYL